MVPEKTSRLFYADILRALAIYAVIILHNAADYDEQLGDIPASHWWAGVIWNGLVRFCVPMFVAMSGAFLLRPGKEGLLKEVFWKRLPKIVIPLVAWSLIYILFDGYFSESGIRSINWLAKGKEFYQGPVAYHLWFLYMMVGIYLLYPVINLFLSVAKPVHIRYFLLVWFFSNCVIKILDMITGTTFGIENNFFADYVGYFVLGYYLVNHTFTRSQLQIGYVLGVCGFLISIFTSYLCVHFNYEKRAVLIESDFTPDIALCVTALILWFKYRQYNDTKPGMVQKVISQVSKESFGIYLVHVLVMQFVFSDNRTYSDTLENWHPGWAIPLKSLIVLSISYVIVKIIRLVPGLKKIVG